MSSDVGRVLMGGFYPSPPPGGGVLVLNKAQLGNLDLLCLIKTIYPETKIIPQQPIPTTTERI